MEQRSQDEMSNLLTYLASIFQEALNFGSNDLISSCFLGHWGSSRMTNSSSTLPAPREKLRPKKNQLIACQYACEQSLSETSPEHWIDMSIVKNKASFRKEKEALSNKY